MPLKSVVRVLVCLVLPILLFPQGIVINELMSSNLTTIDDEDGDYSDWIELYNSGTTTVNLYNYGLTDNPADCYKWVFPDVSIAPGEYLMLFASDKNSTDRVIHLETIINWGDEWKYFLGYSEPLAAWRAADFDDFAWLTGPSGFGFGDDDDSTDVSPADPFAAPPVTIFIRKIFTVDANSVQGMILHVDYDDGIVAYLNETEIARANVGTGGDIPS